jgi:hypothetical protein
VLRGLWLILLLTNSLPRVKELVGVVLLQTKCFKNRILCVSTNHALRVKTPQWCRPVRKGIPCVKLSHLSTRMHWRFGCVETSKARLADFGEHQHKQVVKAPTLRTLQQKYIPTPTKTLKFSKNAR